MNFGIIFVLKVYLMLLIFGHYNFSGPLMLWFTEKEKHAL